MRHDSRHHLLDFAAEDDLFLNYTTAGQLLSQRRFQHLFAVVRDIMEDALGHLGKGSSTTASEVRQVVSEALPMN